MRKKQIILKDYLLDPDVTRVSDDEKKRVEKALENEIQELFEGKNLFGGKPL